MKSSIRCTPTRTSRCGSITNCAIGNTPTTACAPTSRSPTSLHWNSSPVGNSFGERPSVTNLLDEYTTLSASFFPCTVPKSTTPDLDSFPTHIPVELRRDLRALARPHVRSKLLIYL